MASLGTERSIREKALPWCLTRAVLFNAVSSTLHLLWTCLCGPGRLLADSKTGVCAVALRIVLVSGTFFCQTYSYWPMSWDGMGCSAVSLICLPSLPHLLWNYFWCYNHTVFSFPHHTTLDGRSICHLNLQLPQMREMNRPNNLVFPLLFTELSLTSSYVAVPPLSTHVDFKFSSPINSSAGCPHSVICNETQAHEVFCKVWE